MNEKTARQLAYLNVAEYALAKVLEHSQESGPKTLEEINEAYQAVFKARDAILAESRGGSES